MDRITGGTTTGVRDLRLLPVGAAVWAAALIGVFTSGAAGWCAGISGGAAVVLLAASGRSTRAARGGVLVLALAAGAAVSVSVMTSEPARHDAASWSGRVVEAAGEVASSASIGRDGRMWIEVQLASIGSPGDPEPASAPVRVGIEPAEGFDLGAVIRVIGEADATDPGERAALVVFASRATVERPAEGVFALTADLRAAFVERVRGLPEPGAGLLPGLAVGDTRAISTELSDDMRVSGLSHLTAVSGANCAIVVGAVFWLSALCGAARGIRVLLAAVALAGFVVLVTPEPSVVRAAVMAGVGMLAVLLGRPSAGAGMLALSAVGILIVDPWLASTAGFALSVAASGALILLAPPIARGLARWMPASLALAIAVPLAAQLVCAPIIALFAEQQSLVGLAANLLAAPAAPLGTVIGMLACLAAPISPLADLLAATAWLPAAWIAATAEVTASLPLAQIELVPGIGSAMLVACVSSAVGILLLPSRTGRVLRAAAGMVLAVVVALGCAQIVLRGPLAASTSPDGWSISACDVGQGDAMLIRSGGQIALIDTGPEPEPLSDCLRALGIDRIDLLILTHFDRDHAGGVEAVEGRVATVMHGPPGDKADERMLRTLASDGAQVVPVAAGEEGRLGAATWRVLWPQRRSVAFAPGNDSSIVVEISGGGVPRSLLLGDLSAEAQRMLMRSARLRGGYDVVKVAHHGSADQEPELYETLRPIVAVISVGDGNDYGHPREDILAVLRAIGSHVLRTDQQGRLLIGRSDRDLEVWTEE